MEKHFRNFLKSPVSRIVPEKCKKEHPFLLPNRKILKGDPLDTIKKLARKSLTMPKYHAQKNWLRARLESPTTQPSHQHSDADLSTKAES